MNLQTEKNYVQNTENCISTDHVITRTDLASMCGDGCLLGDLLRDGERDGALLKGTARRGNA
eukprot:667209-Amphidinium_carterae.3